MAGSGNCKLFSVAAEQGCGQRRGCRESRSELLKDKAHSSQGESRGGNRTE